MNNINFNFSWKEESAPKLPNEFFKGGVKGRIRMADLGTKEGQDIHAFAAEKIFSELKKDTQNSNFKPKLNVLEKHFNIVVQDPTNSDIYYKINKQSLQKRLGISSEELKAFVNPKSGEVEECNIRGFNALLQKKFQEALTNDIETCVAQCAKYVANAPATLNKSFADNLIKYLNKQSPPVLKATISRLVEIATTNTSGLKTEKLGEMLILLNRSETIGPIVQEICAKNEIKLPQLTQQEKEIAEQEKMFESKLLSFNNLVVNKRKAGEPLTTLSPAILAFLLKHSPHFIPALRMEELQYIITNEDNLKDDIENCFMQDNDLKGFKGVMKKLQNLIDKNNTSSRKK